MSKILALGLSLEDVVASVTSRPAAIIGKSRESRRRGDSGRAK